MGIRRLNKAAQAAGLAMGVSEVENLDTAETNPNEAWRYGAGRSDTSGNQVAEPTRRSTDTSQSWAFLFAGKATA